MTPVPDAVVPHEHLERQLERVDRLYDICVRDYFSTFGTYATATSIFLFGMSFVVEDVKSSVLVLALGLIGIFLCLQWHISTTTMRDQYSHFYARMLMLEEQLGQQVMTRWNDAAMRARGRPSSPTTQSADDASYLTWSFRNLGRGWSQRAAALPVIYSAFFVALMISLGPANHLAGSRVIAAVAALIWLVGGNYLIGVEQRHAHRGRLSDRTGINAPAPAADEPRT